MLFYDAVPVQNITKTLFFRGGVDSYGWNEVFSFLLT